MASAHPRRYAGPRDQVGADREPVQIRVIWPLGKSGRHSVAGWREVTCRRKTSAARSASWSLVETWKERRRRPVRADPVIRAAAMASAAAPLVASDTIAESAGSGSHAFCYALQRHLPDADPAARLGVEGEQDAGEVTRGGQHLATVGQVGRNEPGEHRTWLPTATTDGSMPARWAYEDRAAASGRS